MTSYDDGNGNSSSIENPSATRERKANKMKNILGMQEKACTVGTGADDLLLMTL
jgi:soluble P-type ATPase